LTESSHKSVLALKARTPALPGMALAVLLHGAVFGAAIYLPMLFDRTPPLRKPIIAHMVALGKPRDPRFLPRRDSPPPAAAASPPAPGPVAPMAAPAAPKSPGKALSQPAQKHAPTRQELMQRALARAMGRATPESKEEPDPERAGSATGSTQGTAQSAEEGDAYFTAVHDAILENYVVPSVISERERLYLSATVVAWIGSSGQILKHEVQKKSGNAFFDQALELAIQRTKLPPPPPDLARSLRDNGVVLNFKP
jgi:outer membrane biosynthesis protein TonB